MRHVGLLLLCLVSVAIRAQWIPPEGLYASNIYSVVLHKGALYAAGEPGLFRSTDFGSTWTVIDKFKTQNLFTLSASDNGLFVCTPAVLRSTDDGVTWESLTIDGFEALLAERVFAPEGNILFASTVQGLYRSTNGGDTWQLTNYTLDVHSITKAFGKLYAGTYYGVYASTDNGMTWERRGLVGCTIHSLAVTDAYIVAGTEDSGTWRSADGANWERVGEKWYTFVEIVALGNNFYASAEMGGVYASLDSGATWTRANTGLKNMSMSCIRILDTSLFAGEYGSGLYRWDGGGGLPTWEQCPMANYSVSSFVETPGALLASTYNHSVIRSTDNGMYWTNFPTSGLPDSIQVQEMSRHNGALIAKVNQAGLFRSTDDGSRWQPIDSQLTDLKSYASTGKTLLAGTKNGVQRSTDNGTSWQESGLRALNVSMISASGRYVYAHTSPISYGLIRSSDDGVWWDQVTNFPNSTIDAISFTDSFVFVLSHKVNMPNELHRSSDHGETWMRLDLREVASVQGLGGILYVNMKGGLHFSSDNGLSWTAIGDGLPNKLAANVFVWNGMLFANSHGIWRRSVKEVFDVHESPAQQASISVFPNPAHSDMQVRVVMLSGAKVHLYIVDVLGRTVAEVYDGFLDAGEHVIPFEIGSGKQGTFFLLARNNVTVQEPVKFVVIPSE